MAYKIEYAPDAARRYPQAKNTRKKKPGTWILTILAVAAALWIRLNGVPDFLIPGDPVITRAAASDFVDHVQTGMPVGEAVTAFCQQIIDGAGL